MTPPATIATMAHVGRAELVLGGGMSPFAPVCCRIAVDHCVAPRCDANTPTAHVEEEHAASKNCPAGVEIGADTCTAVVLGIGTCTTACALSASSCPVNVIVVAPFGSVNGPPGTNCVASGGTLYGVCVIPAVIVYNVLVWLYK